MSPSVVHGLKKVMHGDGRCTSVINRILSDIAVGSRRARRNRNDKTGRPRGI